MSVMYYLSCSVWSEKMIIIMILILIFRGLILPVVPFSSDNRFVCRNVQHSSFSPMICGNVVANPSFSDYWQMLRVEKKRKEKKKRLHNIPVDDMFPETVEELIYLQSITKCRKKNNSNWVKGFE